LGVRLAESVSPCRHECRSVESGATIGNNRGEIGIAHLVQSVSLSEGVGFDFEIVEVRNPLNGRLGIVAAIAVLRVEMAPERLLIVQCDFFDLEFNPLLRLVRGRCRYLVAARHSCKRHICGDLPAGIGETVGGIEDDARGSSELD